MCPTGFIKTSNYLFFNLAHTRRGIMILRDSVGGWGWYAGPVFIHTRKSCFSNT